MFKKRLRDDKKLREINDVSTKSAADETASNKWLEYFFTDVEETRSSRDIVPKKLSRVSQERKLWVETKKRKANNFDETSILLYGSERWTNLFYI